MNRSDVKMLPATRRWVCMVGYTGYHNGCNCRPGEDHHAGWDCGWYYVAEPVKAPAPRTATAR